MYFLLHYLPKISKPIKLLEFVYLNFLVIMTFIIVFGNLALAVYTKKNIVLQAQIIHNLPLIVKFFLIHSWWIGVVFLILAIFGNIFTPPFAKIKKHNAGKILMEVRFQRWRFLGMVYLFLFFGILCFILFGVLLKMYAFALFFFLFLLLLSLDVLFYKSLVLTENGVWIKRTFFDVFIPYIELMPLSNQDIQEALSDKQIYIKLCSIGYHSFRLLCKNGHQTRESFMNLYNEKVKEFRQNHLKDSTNAN